MKNYIKKKRKYFNLLHFIQNFNRCVLGTIKNGFIKLHNKIRYLVLFDEWCGKICGRDKYLRSKKIGITDSINHNFGIIRIDSYNSLPIEEILTFHNIIILIKSVVNKNKSEYYYNIFLENGSYKDKSNI